MYEDDLVDSCIPKKSLKKLLLMGCITFINFAKNFYIEKKSSLRRWSLFHRRRIAYKMKACQLYSVIKKHSYTGIKLDVQKYKKRWEKLHNSVNPSWYKIYTYFSGIDDINYVPEDLYYGIIEPMLNDYGSASAYADKNFYDKYYPDLDIFPETLLRNIHGIFYTNDYKYIEKINYLEEYFRDELKLVVKPSIDSGGGRNVQVFHRQENGYYYNRQGEKLSINYLKKNYYRDFLIQKYIESADYFKKLNPTSLNTLRISTYQSVTTNNILTNNCALRIGNAKAEIDNVASGGMACFIYEDGKLCDFGLDKKGNKIFHLPSNPDIKFAELDKIPKFQEIKNAAREIAGRSLYQRLLGLDFCVDSNNKVRLIEINTCKVDINVFQMSGTTLFREYTDEVIEYCIKGRNEGYRYAIQADPML